MRRVCCNVGKVKIRKVLIFGTYLRVIQKYSISIYLSMDFGTSTAYPMVRAVALKQSALQSFSIQSQSGHCPQKIRSLNLQIFPHRRNCLSRNLKFEKHKFVNKMREGEISSLFLKTEANTYVLGRAAANPMVLAVARTQHPFRN